VKFQEGFQYKSVVFGWGIYKFVWGEIGHEKNIKKYQIFWKMYSLFKSSGRKCKKLHCIIIL